MKYKTLKSLLKVAKKEYIRGLEFDQKLQDVLNRDNGDCYIVTSSPVIDDIIDIIIEEYPESEDFIDWFFYDKYINELDLDETFSEDDKEYNLTLKNFYKFLKKAKDAN